MRKWHLTHRAPLTCPIPSQIACAAALTAPAGSFSPIRRATIAVTPMERPIAMVYTIVIRDSVSATVACAYGPSRPTKNMSTTTKMLSIDISSTIGMASATTARLIEPVV